MKKLSFLLLLLMGFSLQTNAQNCSSLLAQNNIRGLAKTGGYIWAATNGGLVKYDTASYGKTYFTNDNSGLPQNSLIQIAADASGNLWMTTAGGLLVKFDGISTFTTFDLGDIYSVTDDYYGSISLVVAGNKVYATFGTKLIYYNGASWSSFNITYSGERDFMNVGSIQYYQNNVYFAIDCTGSSGNSFLSYIQYIKFDGTAFTMIKEFVLPPNGGPQEDQITSRFAMDAQGDFWIAMYEGGISRMDHATLVVIKFSMPSLVKNCPDIYISVMFFFDDNLYMGSIGKGGVLVFNITTHLWDSFTDLNCSLPRSDVNALVFISANTFYIGNDIEIARVSIPDNQSTIHNLNSNKDKLDFFDTYSFNLLDNKLYLSGEKYFGDNDSIKVYNIETSSWSTYTDYGGFNQIAQKVVKDNSGKLWICGVMGIYYLEPSTNKWTHYTRGSADTLTYVSNMLFDKNNNLWAYCNDDLVKIDPTGVIKKIFRGLYTAQFNGLCYDNNNSIYASAGGKSTEAFVKVNIVTDAITRYQIDNYGYTLQYVHLSYANDTLYYYDWDVFGKIHNGSLKRMFELSDYVPAHTRRAPVEQLQSACVDKAGKIWMVDQLSNKIFAYDATTGFQTYDYTNSCLSMTSYEIKCDDRNRKWLKGDGLYRIEDNTMTTPIEHAVSNTSSTDAFVYPNPVSGQANIQLPASSAAVKSVAVLDMKSGETFSIANYTMAEDEVQLNLSFLKQGMYILRITTEDDTERNLKFVKMQ